MSGLTPEQNGHLVREMVANPDLVEALLQPAPVRVEDKDPLIAELERALGIWREVPGV